MRKIGPHFTSASAKEAGSFRGETHVCALAAESSIFCGQKFAIKYADKKYSFDLNHLLVRPHIAFNGLIKIGVSLHTDGLGGWGPG